MKIISNCLKIVLLLNKDLSQHYLHMMSHKIKLTREAKSGKLLLVLGTEIITVDFPTEMALAMLARVESLYSCSKSQQPTQEQYPLRSLCLSNAKKGAKSVCRSNSWLQIHRVVYLETWVCKILIRTKLQ